MRIPALRSASSLGSGTDLHQTARAVGKVMANAANHMSRVGNAKPSLIFERVISRLSLDNSTSFPSFPRRKHCVSSARSLLHILLTGRHTAFWNVVYNSPSGTFSRFNFKIFPNVHVVFFRSDSHYFSILVQRDFALFDCTTEVWTREFNVTFAKRSLICESLRVPGSFLKHYCSRTLGIA